MSSTEISSILGYSQTPVTTRCGEIFCSDNFDNFIINCGTCSQQFNLLSCTLFIKHIRECKALAFQNISDHNMVSQDICSYTIDNLLKDALKSNNIENSGGTAVDPNIEPLMALKLEVVKEKEEPQGFNDPPQEVENLSDYMEEDELPIEKVIRRKKIEGIIDEYRKHPILWDVGMAKSSTNTEKQLHYRQIRKNVNTKFKMDLTNKELHQQIIALRQVYKRVLKRKQSFERYFTDGSTKFNPKLWYFEKLSFIQGLHDDIEVELPSLDETNPNVVTKQEPSDCESSDSGNKQPATPFKKKPERDSCKILCDPPIISDLIAQYKQYPFLWDQTEPLYNSKYARKDAFRKITAFINKKFNKNVTDRGVRQQIVNLRSGYRRVQRKKHDADYRINLWYFDALSFIDRKANEEEKNVVPVEVDISEIQANQGTPAVENQYDSENDDGKAETSNQRRETEIVLAIIEEYKEHPCLYNNSRSSCRFSRADAITEVRTTINNKFATSYTDAEIKAKIAQLRSSYRRILRTKEGFEKLHANANRKFHPQWKYFDKLSFIGTKDSDFSVRRRKSKKHDSDEDDDEDEDDNRPVFKKEKPDHKEHDEDDDEEEETEEESEDEDDNGKYAEPLQHDDRLSAESETEEPKESQRLKVEFVPKQEDYERQQPPPIKVEQMSENGDDGRRNPKSIVKNRALLTAVIEEYRKQPSLWAIKHYTNDNAYRRGAFEEMAKNINAQFNTTYTYKDMSVEIVKLRGTYKRMAKKKQEDPTFEPKLWYVEKLNFIEGKAPTSPAAQENGQEQDFSMAMLNENNPTTSFQVGEEEEEDNMEDIFNQKNKVNSKDIVFEIIDLYRTEPILWNTNHPLHMLRLERRKAIQKITETLGREHQCYLTVEEYRYQIRFLRDSYYRALRQENAAKMGDVGSSYTPKPFFFDRLSFLEPFAEKHPVYVPRLHGDITEPSEDFSYLVQNRPLMLDFIETYKASGCLWDTKHEDKDNSVVHSEAYDKIINTFLKHNVILTKDQVLMAIRFLQYSYVKQQKINDKNLVTNTTSEPAECWFYDNLLFLGKVPQNMSKYCSHCDQHFHTLGAYQKHKIEIAGDYPYKCSVCKAGFVSRSKYAYHQITHKEPHKCDQCGFQAYDKHNFNVHMRRHKGIHPFKCPECDKGFVTSTEMNRHMRMHTGERPFICDICGKSLPANSEFRQHMKRHSNQRDHKCDLCGSAFFTPKTLRDHMASHSNERQHVCETCGAAFKRKKTLHQHKALHAEKKKHECKICGKMFAQKAGVYSHMKSHGLMAGSLV